MIEEERRYEYYYATEARFTPAVSSHFFKLRAIPCVNSCQKVVSHQVWVTPSDCVLNESVDGQGNLILHGNYGTLHDFFRMESSGTVICKSYRVTDEKPNELYLFPSPMAKYDLPMKEWALDATKGCTDAVNQAERLMHALHQRLTYQKFATNNQTTALEVFQKGLGVCQDYAHLMIALCRSVGVMARYANGLVLGEGETHAWVEVYDGMRWIGFDPTYDKQIDWGYLKIAHGRDVYDCPSNRGQFFARTSITEQLTITCKMKEV